MQVIDEQFHQYQQIHLSLQLIGHKKKIMTCGVENPAHGVGYTQICSGISYWLDI
jgi:hypothetical protein